MNEMLIEKLLDKPIAFQRIFVEMTGSIQAGLMLSQAYYWSKRTTLADGWFYKSTEQWTEETGLSRHEQDTARKRLKKTNFWKEKLSGVPATCHYKIDKSAFFSSLLECGNQVEVTESKQSSLPHSGKHSTTETTTETTFVESNDSTPHKHELGSELVLSAEVPNTKTITREKLFAQCVEFWLKELHPSWTFSAVHGKAMKELIVKMRTLCLNKQMIGSDAQVLASFKKMCNNFPDWFKDKDLPVINSKFNEIITQIQNGPQQKSFNSRNSADRFSDYAR